MKLNGYLNYFKLHAKNNKLQQLKNFAGLVNIVQRVVLTDIFYALTIHILILTFLI